MGQGNSKNSKLRKNISFIPKLPEMYVQKEGQKNILQHPELSPVKIYTILINSSEGKQYEKHINFRKNHKQQLIQILYGEFVKEEIQYLKIQMYIEFIPVTLQQVSNVGFRDLLVIFHKVLLGFEILFQQYGAFQPQPAMVGFNEEGQVKVWMNSKYSKCFPQISYKMIDEEKMIISLGQIFMSKVDLKTLPQIKGRKFKFQAKNFQQAISLVEEQFESRQAIPNKIDTIMKLVNLHEEIPKNNEDKISQSQIFLRKTDKTIRFSYANTISELKNPENKKVNISYGNNLNRNSSQQVKARSVSISKSSKVKVNFTNNLPPSPSPPRKEIKRGSSLVKFNYN